MIRDNLTECEQRIYDEFVEHGYKYNQLARIFKLSPQTIKAHFMRIFQKTGANDAKDLLIMHYKEKLENETV